MPIVVHGQNYTIIEASSGLFAEHAVITIKDPCILTHPVLGPEKERRPSGEMSTESCTWWRHKIAVRMEVLVQAGLQCQPDKWRPQRRQWKLDFRVLSLYSLRDLITP